MRLLEDRGKVKRKGGKGRDKGERAGEKGNEAPQLKFLATPLMTPEEEKKL